MSSVLDYIFQYNEKMEYINTVDAFSISTAFHLNIYTITYYFVKKHGAQTFSYKDDSGFTLRNVAVTLAMHDKSAGMEQQMRELGARDRSVVVWWIWMRFYC